MSTDKDVRELVEAAVRVLYWVRPDNREAYSDCERLRDALSHFKSEGEL